MQTALIKKDIRGVTANKNLFQALLILPLIMAVILPAFFIFVTAFLEPADLQELLASIGQGMLNSGLRETLIQLILNDITPFFFLMVPTLVAMVMAASSFVGEKEKRTLETLLYCPLSLRQIFIAKIIAPFVLSQFVSIVSFAAMTLVAQTEILFITGSLMLPGLSWPVLLLLVSPAASMVMITLIVRDSAKDKSIEEAQQRSGLLILPILLLVIGAILISVWLLLGIGVFCAIVALILLRRSSVSFNYERLLQ